MLKKSGKAILVTTLLFLLIASQNKNPIRKFKAEETIEGEETKVHRLFPIRKLSNYDPFVMLDDYSSDKPELIGAHEHRGFEAVTYQLEGSGKHRDNLGNQGIITGGAAQRFTAGKSIVHEEGLVSNRNRGLQLWVNLPKSLKQTEPSYQKADSVQLPTVKEDKAIIRTIVGQGSPITLHTSVLYQDIQAQKGFEKLFNIPSDYRGFIYVLEGTIRVDSIETTTYEGVFFEVGEHPTVRALTNSRFILLAGKPIGEPIKQRGSFVY